MLSLSRASKSARRPTAEVREVAVEVRRDTRGRRACRPRGPSSRAAPARWSGRSARRRSGGSASARAGHPSRRRPSRTWAVRSCTSARDATAAASRLAGSPTRPRSSRGSRRSPAFTSDWCTRAAERSANSETRKLSRAAQDGRQPHAIRDRRQRLRRARRPRAPAGTAVPSPAGKRRAAHRHRARRQTRDIPVDRAVVARLQHRVRGRRGAESARPGQPHRDRADRHGLGELPARSTPRTRHPGRGGARPTPPNEPSIEGDQSSSGCRGRDTDAGRSASCAGRAGNATTFQSVDQSGASGGSPARRSPGRAPPCGERRRARRRRSPPPSTTVSDQTSFFMASSGSTQGAPAALQPEDVATASSSPRSAAVRHGGGDRLCPGRRARPHRLGTTSGTPMPPSKSCTPRTPTS